MMIWDMFSWALREVKIYDVLEKVCDDMMLFEYESMKAWCMSMNRYEMIVEPKLPSMWSQSCLQCKSKSKGSRNCLHNERKGSRSCLHKE
jgi:hypothetical protein